MISVHEAVIVAAARSPLGRAENGALADLRADDLAAFIVAATLAEIAQLRSEEIEDLYLGCAEPSDEQGANIARRVAVLLGLDDLPGTTVTRLCASSLQAIRMAFYAIEAGEGDVFVAAGVESVSRNPDGAQAYTAPLRGRNPRFEAAGERTARLARGADGWSDPRETGEMPDVYLSMGATAENVATLFDISRREQDLFALRSQERVRAARADGFFDREIVPVELFGRLFLEVDESPRSNTTIEALSELKPAVRPGGTVTSGNSCSLSDGAAAVVVMSDERARDLKIEPLARIVSTGVSALSPELMGLGSIDAGRQALRRAGMSIGDVDLVELNEDFAAQAIACCRELGVDDDRVNAHGGTIALGNPVGMTGARMTAALINGLAVRDGEIGLLTTSVGGGQGMAMVLQRLY